MYISKKDLKHVIECKGYNVTLKEGTKTPIFNVDGSLERYQINDTIVRINCEICTRLKEKL